MAQYKFRIIIIIIIIVVVVVIVEAVIVVETNKDLNYQVMKVRCYRGWMTHAYLELSVVKRSTDVNREELLFR